MMREYDARPRVLDDRHERFHDSQQLLIVLFEVTNKPRCLFGCAQ
jgi:hypothetical protein